MAVVVAFAVECKLVNVEEVVCSAVPTQLSLDMAHIRPDGQHIC